MATYSGWVEYDKQTNAEATATKAAESGRNHVIYTINENKANTTSVTWFGWLEDVNAQGG